MLKPEYYVNIKGEDEIRITEDDYISLKEILLNPPIPEYFELKEKVYKTKNIEAVKKINVNYAE